MNTANIISYFIVALLRSDLWNEETGNNKRKKKRPNKIGVRKFN